MYLEERRPDHPAVISLKVRLLCPMISPLMYSARRMRHILSLIRAKKILLRDFLPPQLLLLLDVMVKFFGGEESAMDFFYGEDVRARARTQHQSIAGHYCARVGHC